MRKGNQASVPTAILCYMCMGLALIFGFGYGSLPIAFVFGIIALFLGIFG